MKSMKVAVITLFSFIASTSAVFADIVDPRVDGGGEGNMILPICLAAAALVVIVIVIKVFRKK